MSPPETSLSYRQKRLAQTRTRKAAKMRRREAMLDGVVNGLDTCEIARTAGVSVKTVRREIDRALHERPLEAPGRYAQVQVERLNKAMRAIGVALDAGDLKAVKPLLAVQEKLDRYHGMAALAGPEAEPAAPRLARAEPLALTHAPISPLQARIEAEEEADVARIAP
jgi:hypothetical protein